MTSITDPALGWSIGVLFRSWQEGASRALSGLPHGARGFQILVTVAHQEPPTQAALAAHLGIDRTVLTYVLDDLVAAGLVERQPHPGDRRVRRVAPTEAGRNLLQNLEQRVAGAERELLDGLSAEQQAMLRESLLAAAAQIHRRDPGRSQDACTEVVQILGSS